MPCPLLRTRKFSALPANIPNFSFNVQRLFAIATALVGSWRSHQVISQAMMCDNGLIFWLALACWLRTTRLVAKGGAGQTNPPHRDAGVAGQPTPSCEPSAAGTFPQPLGAPSGVPQLSVRAAKRARARGQYGGTFGVHFRHRKGPSELPFLLQDRVSPRSERPSRNYSRLVTEMR